MMPGSVLPAAKAYPSIPVPTSNPGNPHVLTESSNSLKHPTGPDYQFQANEGTYVLRDDFQLATPPPHPSESPASNTNPLSTAVLPPVSGTRLSVVITSDKKAPPILYNLNAAIPNFSTYSIKEQDESRPSQDSNAKSSDLASQSLSNGSDLKAPAFGSTNILLHAATVYKDGAKRKKPKTNMMKTSSTFVSRVVSHESLSRRLSERDPDSMLVFANINRAFQWLDISTESNFKADHLTKILFTKAHILCHDFNKVTKAASHLDFVAGSSHPDLIWYEPFSVRYNRINKNGIINPSPVLDVKWIPGSEHLFLAAHKDGSLIVYDKEREDAAFVPEDGQMNGSTTSHEDGSARLHVRKSINSKNQKTNPVACWKISDQKINSFAISPDCRHLAVASQDGFLRILDYLKEKLLDVFPSYYGGFTCVCWSPDGKYILTGGQDDLITIWSLNDQCIVARCPGHTGFVSDVAFDPWRCNDRNYRFGSVGEDGKLLLWDFNYNTLSKPRTAAQRVRSSIATSGPLHRLRTDSISASRLRSNSSLTTYSNPNSEEIEHDLVSRSQTAELPPVMSKIVDDDPLSGLSFQEDCIITSCWVGHIRIWDRPKEGANES